MTKREEKDIERLCHMLYEIALKSIRLVGHDEYREEVRTALCACGYISTDIDRIADGERTHNEDFCKNTLAWLTDIEKGSKTPGK